MASSKDDGNGGGGRPTNRLRDAEGKTGPFRDLPRHSQSEVETMAMILNHLPVLRSLVMDRLKQAKARARTRDAGRSAASANPKAS
jgi:hypothetical protein